MEAIGSDDLLSGLAKLFGLGEAQEEGEDGDDLASHLGELLELLQILAAQCGSDSFQQPSDGMSGGLPGGAGPAGVGPAGGSAGGSAGSRGPCGPMPAGNVGSWIQQAMALLQQSGVDTSKIDPRDVAAMIKHESGGNPHAQNNWDSNAKKGTPSKGLMQTIQPTFDRYKLPGYGDVWNPVHNIAAAIRYSLARYGSISNVPGVKAVHQGQGYRGY